MVEDYLRDHPGQQVGPTAIVKALGGKSSGGVSNALDKQHQSELAGHAPDQAGFPPSERSDDDDQGAQDDQEEGRCSA